MIPNNNPLFTSLAALNDQTSGPQWSEKIVRASFQLVTTDASADGTIQVQASNDQAYGAPANQFQPTNWNNLGSPVTVSGLGSFLIPEFECSYEYLRLVWLSTATGAQTVAPIADTGAKQHQTVTTVADTAGSLNSKYFLLSSVNKVSKAQKNFYLWLDDGGGVDPAVAGRTGIHVTYSDGDTANTIATQIRAALNGLTDDFTATGATSAVIINSVAFGPVTAAVDGAAPTGFSFGARTVGVASNLNNKWFYLQDQGSANLFYVWMNVDSIGTDPAVATRTGIEVDFASGASAGTIGAALATAVAAANSSGSFTTSGTTTVTITNVDDGPFVPATDGTAATGFTFTLTSPTGTVSARMKSMGL